MRICAPALLLLTACVGLDCGREEMPAVAKSLGAVIQRKMVGKGAHIARFRYRRPAVEPITSRDLDGIFPPRWQLGQTWRVSLSAFDAKLRDEKPRYGQQFTPERVRSPRELSFAVVAVPGAEGGRYGIRVVDGKRCGSSRLEPQWSVDLAHYVEYRGDDGSLASVLLAEPRCNWPTTTDVLVNDRAPFMDAWTGHMAFIFPQAPPVSRGEALENPRFFDAGRDPCAQTIRRGPRGLVVTIECYAGLEISRAVLEWEPGAPWWSRITCGQSLTPGEEDDESRRAGATCHGFLREDTPRPPP